MEKANSAEVKRSFVLAYAMKIPFKSGESVSFKTLMRFHEEMLRKYSRYNERDLEKLINGFELGKSLEEIEASPKTSFGENGDRVNRYNKLSWSYDLVELNRIGAWPEMRGIDPRLTKGSITETAIEINNYLSGKTSYDFSDERKEKLDELIKLVNSMKKNKLIWK